MLLYSNINIHERLATLGFQVLVSFYFYTIFLFLIQLQVCVCVSFFNHYMHLRLNHRETVNSILDSRLRLLQ